ncbi:hypothetical protein [Ferruginibacter sp.]|uniref:hypothetical protein n=1 Tax=Ferruginibacter sp. TaxID=1940288 RepID=UPI0019950064|nr:hypothetical protein [Ferruginibacter sp.]MBC7628837.1 hypothetical protein [Ferruginibacter sp.]
MELKVSSVSLEVGVTSIHGQRKFQQKIFAAFVIEYFMWIVWNHCCGKGKFLFVKSELGLYFIVDSEKVGAFFNYRL